MTSSLLTGGALAEGATAPLGRAPLRVCLVAHMAYGALTGTGGHIGGVEYQTSLLARWLARRGHQVSMITWDEGQSSDFTSDGIRIVKLCRQSDGWPLVRFFHPRWSSLVLALRAADADVYYQNCAEYVTGQVALWCRANARRFVYSAASDSDCDARLPLLTTARERVLYRVGLRRADQVIVQTERQREMLRVNFRRDATVIPMPGEEPREPVERTGIGRPSRVAWVGRICDVKRPDRLLDLAARQPERQFDLVGPTDDSDYATRVLARAAAMPNILVHGALTQAGVGDVLREALCLCSTSEIEGFPNTFLEAWSRAVPVLSMVDPGDVIAREGLGWIAVDLDELDRRLEAIISNDEERDRAGRNGRDYFLRTHAAGTVLPRFEALLLSTAEAVA